MKNNVQLLTIVNDALEFKRDMVEALNELKCELETAIKDSDLAQASRQQNVAKQVKKLVKRAAKSDDRLEGYRPLGNLFCFTDKELALAMLNNYGYTKRDILTEENFATIYDYAKNNISQAKQVEVNHGLLKADIKTFKSQRCKPPYLIEFGESGVKFDCERVLILCEALGIETVYVYPPVSFMYAENEKGEWGVVKGLCITTYNQRKGE